MASDSASRGPVVVAVSAVFTILALFFVATRFLARAVFLKNAGRDELAILASTVRLCSRCHDVVEIANVPHSFPPLHCL